MENALLSENEFQLFKSKDTLVFKKVYNEYFNLIHYVARRCGADTNTSDDIVQETFIRLYNKSEQIYEQGNIKSWLVTTARNLCLDQIRKDKLENKFNEQELQDEHRHEKTSHKLATFATESEIHELELTLIGDLIDKVTLETNDDTFSLFYRDGLSAKEIASRKNAPVSTVTNRLSRLRIRFQGYFESHIKQLHDELL